MWPNPRFAKNCIFDCGHVQDENVNFSNNFGPIQDFVKNWHFDHCGLVEDENFNFSKKFWPDPGFCSKLSFLTTYSGHVEEENLNFSKSVGPMQDFAAQNCLL